MKDNNINMSLNDIISDLREDTKKVRWWQTLFTIFLLSFTAYNTFRLFGESFSELSIVLALAAIGFFDGGFLFWSYQVRRVSKDFSQRAISSVMRWICGTAAVSMTAIDMILHSGQEYIPLDGVVQLYGGWEATIFEVAGASAMLILIAVIISNIVGISLFDDFDIEIKQAIAERVAQNSQKRRELAAFEARARLQNEMMAQVIKQLGVTAQDEITEESDKLAKQMLPEIRKEFMDHIQKRRNNNVFEGQFNKGNRPIIPPAPRPSGGYAKDVEDEIDGGVVFNRPVNRPPHKKNPNPPKA